MTHTPNDPKCGFCGAGQKEVQKLLKGDALAVYICDGCVFDASNIMQDLIQADNRAPKKGSKTDRLTPKQIMEHLNEFVIGQENAKKLLSIGVYNHYKRIGRTTKTDLGKSNVLLVGPTGSGKTYIVETIAKFLKVPFASADATQMTEAGYVGDDVDTVLVRLIQACDGDIARAEKGIVYIDEIDKIATRESRGRDVSGEGVQQGLLKMLEGSVMTINPSGKKNSQSANELINTKDILFICGGAFSGITDFANNKKKVLGFVDHSIEQDKKAPTIRHKDIVKYGMIPEFVGRFPIIAQLNSLGEDDLVKILTEPKNSLVKQYQDMMLLDGVKITFDPAFLREVAKRAKEEGTGARGLRAIMEPALMDIMFTAPDGNKDQDEVNVTIDFLETP